MTAAELRAVAAELGIALGDAEAEVLGEVLRAQLSSFAALATEEAALAPTPEEDPHRAWLWRCRIDGRPGGPLHGRTVGFKDHVAVAGLPLTYNARPLEHEVAPCDATVVSRVLEAGGTVSGKHVLSGITTADHAVARRGPPLHPHDPTRATGGSSSGSAVAVAAGEVDIAFGGDQGGSVRVPAAWCGVVGLKPTFGLVSHTGATFHGDPSLDHLGPLARNVADVALALEAVAGTDGIDPRQGVGVPVRLDVVGGLEAGIEGLRIGVLEEGFDEPVQPGVCAAVVEAVGVLADLGADVRAVSVPEHRTAHTALSVIVAHGVRARRRATRPGDALGRLVADQVELLVPHLRANLLAAELSWRDDGGAALRAARGARVAATHAYDLALVDADVLAMPTCPTVAPLLAAPTDRPAALRAALGSLADPARSEARNTRIFNLTGHPALTVPCGTVDGLPVGLQLVGRRLDDPLVMRVAYAYEQAASA